MFRVGARRPRLKLLSAKLSAELTVMLLELSNDREDARKVPAPLRPETAVGLIRPPVPKFREAPKV